MTKAHFVYMLRCKGDRIYTGYAVDVESRYNEHCSGKGAKFTKAFPPECVLCTFELESREKALRLEARIKKLKRPQKELLAPGDEALSATMREGLDELLKSRRKRSIKNRLKKTA
jgi:putative endonuclease